MKQPSVSVIIPAHNEEKVIGKCLDAFMRQTSKDFELIIVNDGSIDSTVNIVKKYPVRLINFDRGHSAAFARNRGSEIAKGKILVFVDADIIVEPMLIEKIIRSFKNDKELSAIGTNAITHKPESFIQKCWAVKRESFRDKPVPCVIFKKDVFKRLGGYDEKIFYYEDADLTERLKHENYKFVMNRSIKEYHIDPRKFSDFVRQRKWQGRALFDMVKKRKFKQLIYFLPCIFLIMPPIFLIYFIYSWLKLAVKTKKIKYTLGWVSIDSFGRLISLYQFIKMFFSKQT